jgi:hypothetical protein
MLGTPDAPDSAADGRRQRDVHERESGPCRLGGIRLSLLATLAPCLLLGRELGASELIRRPLG